MNKINIKKILSGLLIGVFPIVIILNIFEPIEFPTVYALLGSLIMFISGLILLLSKKVTKQKFTLISTLLSFSTASILIGDIFLTYDRVFDLYSSFTIILLLLLIAYSLVVSILVIVNYKEFINFDVNKSINENYNELQILYILKQINEMYKAELLNTEQFDQLVAKYKPLIFK